MPENGTFLDILKTHTGLMFPWLDFEQALLRGPSPLSEGEGERELLVAYVSGLNTCSYCHRCHTFVAAEYGHRCHTFVAAEYGFPEDLPARLIEDLDTAEIEDQLKAAFRFATKLTESPARMTDGDTAELYDAGWDDGTVFHIIAVISYPNFVNRLVGGIGLEANDGPLREIAKMLKTTGYASIKEFVEGEAGN
jgi:uncharacterized peroxidase-related enzyme